MKKSVRTSIGFTAIFFALIIAISPAQGAEPQLPPCATGTQEDGSFGSRYRIYMPPPGVAYNNRFIIWAHGFQDAGTPVEIPEGQLCINDVCLPDILGGLGFGFATNSYRKTGLAILDGMADINDLADNLIQYGGETCDIDRVDSVYLIGASEGGLITALLAEQEPDRFRGGFALCGPYGDFTLQINYLGDARVTFEYFFPNIIPGYNVFNAIERVDIDRDGDIEYVTAQFWDAYFAGTIGPLLASQPGKFEQWARVARLPFDPNDKFNTALFSAKEALRFSVIYPNLDDAQTELGGMPFDNRWKWYTGSYNDFRLNRKVKRLIPDAAAISEMRDHYNTSGALDTKLITMHTKRDPQVPYFHAIIYSLKTFAHRSYLKDHFNIPVDRYGHCNFTIDEALGGFALMLLYAGDWESLIALEAIMENQ